MDIGTLIGMLGIAVAIPPMISSVRELFGPRNKASTTKTSPPVVARPGTRTLLELSWSNAGEHNTIENSMKTFLDRLPLAPSNADPLADLNGPLRNPGLHEFQFSTMRAMGIALASVGAVILVVGVWPLLTSRLPVRAHSNELIMFIFGLVMCSAGCGFVARGRRGLQTIRDYQSFLASRGIRMSHEFTQGPEGYQERMS